MNWAWENQIVIENAQRDSTTVTVIHQGGDIVTGAFNKSATTTSDAWAYIEVRHKGAKINETTTLNDKSVGNWLSDDFVPGDELKITFTSGLVSGDTIAVVYTPSGDMLQRVKVS